MRWTMRASGNALPPPHAGKLVILVGGPPRASSYRAWAAREKAAGAACERRPRVRSARARDRPAQPRAPRAHPGTHSRSARAWAAGQLLAPARCRPARRRLRAWPARPIRGRGGRGGRFRNLRSIRASVGLRTPVRPNSCAVPSASDRAPELDGARPGHARAGRGGGMTSSRSRNRSRSGSTASRSR